MKEIGYDHHPVKRKKTLFIRLREILERHRVQYSITLAVIASMSFILAETVPPFKEYITQSNLLQYITFIVLIDLAVTFYLEQRPQTTFLMENQDASIIKLTEAIEQCKADGVDLFEYAGSTTLPLIRTIQRRGITMRLLVKHPDTVSGLQKNRMITTLDTLYNSIFDDYIGNFEIRCYKLPYTLRGRRLGKEMLELGWLTPDIKRETAYGHGNPSILVDLSVRNNEFLLNFFKKTFNDYWTDPDTEDGLTVLNRFQSDSTVTIDKSL